MVALAAACAGDNRCTLHYAVHDHGDVPRRLLRITIAGDEVPAGPT
jgi:alpha-ketoglutarate-dependent taurine dioxygenase